MQANDRERNLSEIRNYVNEIMEFVLEKAGSHQAHEMEKELKGMVLRLGKLFLQLYFTAKGTGYRGERLEGAAGLYYRDYKQHRRTYFSIFGKISVNRTCYKRHNEENIFPLDIEANLPKRSYSYPLQELMNLQSLQHPYGDSSETIERILGLELSVNALEVLSEDGAESYGDYYERREVERSRSPVLALGFDGKGIPMIQEEAKQVSKARLSKGEKRQKKKEALAGVCYECDHKFRNAKDIAQNLVFGKDRQKPGDQSDARARHTRRTAGVSKPKAQVVDMIAAEALKRDPLHQCLWTIIMDGAPGLWKLVNKRFKGIDYVPVLDIIHVTDYLWEAAHAFFKENSPELKIWVYEKLVAILEGKTGRVIGSLRQQKTKRKLRGKKAQQVEKAITYFENHRQWMKYDQYLEQGLPIASGVVESTCGHLIKDRMERSGCRWNLDGAEAILKLRSVKTSHDWDEYWQHHIANQEKRLYTCKLAA